MLSELHELVLEAKAANLLDAHAEIACVVAGDFNNEPFRAAYELLSDGRLHSDAGFASARIDADSFLDQNGQVCLVCEYSLAVFVY